MLFPTHAILVSLKRSGVAMMPLAAVCAGLPAVNYGIRVQHWVQRLRSSLGCVLYVSDLAVRITPLSESPHVPRKADGNCMRGRKHGKFAQGMNEIP